MPAAINTDIIVAVAIMISHPDRRAFSSRLSRYTKVARNGADADDEPDPNLGQRLLSLGRLERALAHSQQALTVVRAQVALIEAEAADIQARLDRVGQRDG